MMAIVVWVGLEESLVAYRYRAVIINILRGALASVGRHTEAFILAGLLTHWDATI
jgi:hypothetical protein